MPVRSIFMCYLVICDIEKLTRVDKGGKGNKSIRIKKPSRINSEWLLLFKVIQL